MQLRDRGGFELAEDRLQFCDGGIGIGQVVGHGVDALGGKRAYEHRAVPIGNEPTPCKDFDGVGALCERLGREGRTLHDLDEIEAHAEIERHRSAEIEKQFRAHRCDAREGSVVERARHGLEPGEDRVEHREPRLRNDNRRIDADDGEG